MTTPTTRSSLLHLSSTRRTVRDCVALLALVALVRLFVLSPVEVLSDSMAPSLQRGDVALVRHRTQAPAAGEVVTFRSPLDGTLTIKRVVAVGGQRVGMDDGRLVVDGELVPEPWVDTTVLDGTFWGDVRVGDDMVFVLGDEREYAIDSRHHGAVPLEDVEGAVVLRVWPPSRVGRP